MLLANVVFHAAYACYSLCTLLYLTYLFTKRETFSQGAHGLLLSAFAMHMASLIMRTLSTHTVPWADLFETLSFFSAIIALIFMAISHKNHIPILGAFIMPISWALLTAAVFANKTRRAVQPEFPNYWIGLHVPILFTAYAFLGVAFAVGIAYLLQERQMKSKHPNALTYRLPPLDELDALMSHLVIAAFPLLTIGILLGGIGAHEAWGRYWGWDPKETWALITWMIYALYLLVRYAAGWRGRKTAYLSLAGFALVLFTYVGVNYISPRHAFLSSQGR